MYDTSAETLDPKIGICRLCLSYTKVYIYLNQNEKLCQMLKSFTSIEILPLDENSIVCYKCRLNLNLAYYIQQNMLKAEEKFQQQMLSTMIKEEPDFEFSEQEVGLEKHVEIFPEIKELKQTCCNDSTENLYRPPLVTEKVENCLSKPNSLETYNITELGQEKSEIFPELKELKQICSNYLTLEDNLYRPPVVTEKIEYPQPLVTEKTGDHLSEPTSPELYCKSCNRYYSSQKALLAHHKQLHLLVKCSECGRTEPAGRIKTHMKRYHPGYEAPKLISEPKHMRKSPELYCKICNKYYSSRKAILAHRKQLHLSIKCPECDKNIPAGRIKTHMKRCHPGCQVPNSVIHKKQYIKLPEAFCKICDRYYISKERLLVHKKLIHTNIKCNQCGLDMKSGKIQRHFKKFHPGCEIPKIMLSEPKEPDENETYCKICDKYYIDRHKLRTHQKLFHTTLKCDFCNKDILTGKIQSHFDKLHPGCEVPRYIPEPKQQNKSPEVYCKICDRYFINRASLKRHERLIHSTIIKCYVCELEVTMEKIQQHIETTHPGHEVPKKITPKYHCETCSKVFEKKGTLVLHMQTHVERVCCPKCPSKIPIFNLQKHMDKHHGGPSETTQARKKSTLKKDANENKTRKRGRIKTDETKKDSDNENEPGACTICNKVFDNKTSLKKHIPIHDRSICPICGKSVTKINLQAHIETHSTTGQQICELCGATLKNRGCLRVHMQLVHQEAQFKCNYCDRRFKRKLIRKQHENKEHLIQPNFVCDICGKKFYARKYLKAHINTKHLKLRPFHCGICKNSYSSQCALTTHMRIHTNETPYKCHCCGEGFRQKVSLKSHLKSKHNIEEELTVFCKECGKGFASKVALYTHKRVHE